MRKKKKLFPDFLRKWNDLVIQKQIPEMESALGRRVIVDVAAVHDANQRANEGQVVDSIPRDLQISESMVDDAVRGYAMAQKSGTGLVFIMERLDKATERACMQVVVFDVASRDVRMNRNICEEAGGFGFRNYWIAPIKQVIEKLKNLRKAL